MRSFMIFLIGLVTGAAILAGFAAVASANAGADVTADQVQNLLGRYASGLEARPSDARTVAFVIDSTERYGLSKARCGFNSSGARISADGEWYEADLYGKTMRDIGSRSEQLRAKNKLSYYLGLCYLKTSGQSIFVKRQALAGATRRTALALSKMLNQPVELRDPNGKSIGVYRWSNKW
jgi:hypothetical protein